MRATIGVLRGGSLDAPGVPGGMLRQRLRRRLGDERIGNNRVPSDLSSLVGTELRMRPVPLSSGPHMAVLIEKDIGKNQGHLCRHHCWRRFLQLPSLWPGPRVGSGRFRCRDHPPNTMPTSSGIGGASAMMHTKTPHQDHRNSLQRRQPDC
jgi:hypothetical protein